MRSILACLLLLSAWAQAAPPFEQTFVDVRASKFTNPNLDYYRTRGLNLQTVDYYKKNGREYIVGSFNRGLLPGWEGYINLNHAEYLEVYRNMRAKGFSPRQISVSVFSGAPAYSPVFMQEAGWVAQQSMHDLDDRGFNDFMFRMAQQQFSIIDHSAYYVNGVRLHAAVFQRDSYTRMYYGDYTKVGIEDLQTQKNRELWWVRSIDATRGPDGFDLYSVILHYGADITFAHFGMTASEFRGKNREYNRQGRHLLQVKAHSGLFSGVWSSSVLP